MNRIEDQLAAIRTDIAQLRADLGGNGREGQGESAWRRVVTNALVACQDPLVRFVISFFLRTEPNPKAS